MKWEAVREVSSSKHSSFSSLEYWTDTYFVLCFFPGAVWEPCPCEALNQSLVHTWSSGTYITVVSFYKCRRPTAACWGAAHWADSLVGTGPVERCFTISRHLTGGCRRADVHSSQISATAVFGWPSSCLQIDLKQERKKIIQVVCTYEEACVHCDDSTFTELRVQNEKSKIVVDGFSLVSHVVRSTWENEVDHLSGNLPG